MPSLSADLVVHKLHTYPDFPPDQQKQRKLKTDMRDKIKEKIMKQLSANMVKAVRYTTWVENIVPMPKKDGKTRVCVDYMDLTKASPKDNFPLPYIHILIDNCAKHEIQSFMDCYAGYHQILMDKDDAENTTFTTPWEPPVLVPPELCRPLFLYLSMMDNFFGCVLGQHDATSKKEQAIYYLSKKFTNYEVKYTLFERTCSQAIYVTRITMKARTLADHLAENPVDDDYKQLSTYFPDEEVNSIDEVVPDDNHMENVF
nr:uncharacterized protein LOC104099231 [Nicotiana tomentosiformis]